jgi:uncharacterized membrane protein HdeD (DUF308 family)
MTTATTAEPGKVSVVPWWIILIQGIAAIVLGFFLLTSPGKTTVILVDFLGIYWLISGIFSIVSIFIDHTAWGWKLFSGILGIIAGILIVQHPLWSTILVPTVLIIVFGIEGLIIGVVNLIQAFQGGGWGIAILGVLSIIFGLILLFNPLIGALALPWVLGIFGIVGGIAAIFMAFRMR